MKIKVSYSELRSDGKFGHTRAEAELEVEVNGDLELAFQRAWDIVKNEVKTQLNPATDPEETPNYNVDEDLPF